MIGNLIGLLIRPKAQWQSIAANKQYSLIQGVAYIAVMAFIPALAWYYGTTVVGWTVGGGEPIRLTTDSAGVLISLFYLTMLVSLWAIGFMIHWMANTYGADSSIAKGIVVAGFSATPLFVAGVVGFVPIFWVSLVLAVGAVCYAVYLLYLGIPAVMDIPDERGFLFSSAVIAFCLVILMMIMGGSAILWDMGAMPQFTD